MDKENSKKKIVRKLKGTVVADASDKTISVRVDRSKLHPKYLKSFKVSKKYQVHDPENKFKKGDVVEFTECRPLSKNKRWLALYK